MAKRSIELKSKQLGVGFCKANGILIKSLLYHYVKIAGLNTCYRCGKEITSPNDFTKDHVVDWMHSHDPKGLFFDVNNIKFSHSKCNRSRRQQVNRAPTKHGYRGVFKKDKRYRAVHTIYGPNRTVVQRMYSTVYDTPLEAALAYDTMMTTKFGPDAITNASLGLL